MMYLLKLNIALIALFGFYMLMFSSDTFFLWRRASLIGMYFVAMLVPGLNFSYWINKSVGMLSIANEYATIILPTVSITPGKGGSLNWESTATTLYIMMVSLLFLRFLWQLFSIVRLKNKCKTAEIDGKKVYLLETEDGPFSFFNWIFINQSKHNQKEITEIMTHELTHCRQQHNSGYSSFRTIFPCFLGKSVCVVAKAWSAIEPWISCRPQCFGKWNK